MDIQNRCVDLFVISLIKSMPSLGVHINGKTYAWVGNVGSSNQNGRSILSLIKKAIRNWSRVGSRDRVIPIVDGQIPAVISVVPNQQVIDISAYFDSSSQGIIESAYELAADFMHEQVDPLHLFVGSLKSPHGKNVLARLEIEFDSIKNQIQKRLEGRALGKPTRFSFLSESVLLEAFRRALLDKTELISSIELMWASYIADPFIQELILGEGVDKEKFLSMIDWIRIHEAMQARYSCLKKNALFSSSKFKQPRSIVSCESSSVCEDLTCAVIEGRIPMLIGREEEINEIFRILEEGRQSVVLVGPKGVGKSAIVGKLAELICEQRAPSVLNGKNLLRVSIKTLLLDVDHKEAQKRFASVLNEASGSGNIILVISNIEQLVAEDSSVEESGLLRALVDYFSCEGKPIIATSTPQAFTSVIEKSELGRVFEEVEVSEPDVPTAIRMLESKIGSIENEHGVIFTFDAIESIVAQTDRYIPEAYLPEKAIDIAREVAFEVADTRGKNALVTSNDVSAVVSKSATFSE